MASDLINIILGFLEGFILILSPCILTVLPLILAGSLTGSLRRSFGILLGFTLTFALFVFFARNVVQYSGVDLNQIRPVAYGVLFLLGLILLSNTLTEKFNLLMERLISLFPRIALSNKARGGFYSGILMGALVAIVWTPCAGPVVAAVLVQIAIQKTSLISFLTLLAFAAGVAIPMLIITFYGLKIRDSFRFFKRHANFFRKALGAIIILSLAFTIAQEKGYVSYSASLSNRGPATHLEDGLLIPYKAPPIAGITAWINSPPLRIEDLKGKVVLVDFWTYSCINCIRTLPYLKEWYKKYHDKGLVIIGVHAAEFEFEKKLDNIRHAVKQDGIDYPVAVDNDYVTWRNYTNHYWPAHYLIDKQGRVVYVHYGEGKYDVTENNIRFLAGVDKTTKPTIYHGTPYSYFETPETYLGYARAETYLSPMVLRDKVKTYHFPSKLPQNAWVLQGAWQVNSDNIIAAEANAALKIHFKAKKVFIVMGNEKEKPIKVTLKLNGKPLQTGQGNDVKNSHIVVDKHKLYEAIALPQFGEGILEISTDEPGLAVYTFTFGS